MTTDAGADGGGAGGAAGGDGSAAAAAAAAAAGAAAGGAAGGDGGAAKPWYEGFASENLRTHPAVHRYQSAEALAEGYINLEKRFGVDPARRIDLPADPNDADGMRAVYAKLGMPEKADGYQIKLADNATDADKAVLGKALETFHKAGLSGAQAKVIGEFINEQTAAQQAAAVEQHQAAAAAGKTALQKEWGGAYDARAKEVGNAVAKYSDNDPDLIKELSETGIGNYPKLARMIGKMLDRMAEPGAAGGLAGDGGGQDRPLMPDQAKAQARAIEGDPEKSKALRDSKHPQHKAVVEERNRLLRISEGQTV